MRDIYRRFFTLKLKDVPLEWRQRRPVERLRYKSASEHHDLRHQILLTAVSLACELCRKL